MNACIAIDNGLYSMAYNWSLNTTKMNGWLSNSVYIDTCPEWCHVDYK